MVLFGPLRADPHCVRAVGGSSLVELRGDAGGGRLLVVIAV